ncbi:hypothetical protein [Achromobacter xylosoxidans]|uniref:hypothetical protein n=1 Tax=Alcaligenes xylosoxydans xylosoxydans TaxID=85698 RepID=UPI0038FD068F
MSKDLSDALLSESAKLEVLRLALVTLIKLQPAELRETFLTAFLMNAEMWGDVAINTENPDIWIESLRSHADHLRQMIEG